MSETPTRLIGPIISSWTGPSEDDVFAHPGGPCPAWGGYRPLPVEVPLSWLAPDVQEIVTQPGTCWGSEGRSLRGDLYRAHTTDTLLIRASDGWYVACPARPCRRAVTIGVEALYDRHPLPGGLLSEEVAEAQRIHTEGGAIHRHRLPWEPAEDPWPTASAEEVEVFQRRSEDE